MHARVRADEPKYSTCSSSTHLHDVGSLDLQPILLSKPPRVATPPTAVLQSGDSSSNIRQETNPRETNSSWKPPCNNAYTLRKQGARIRKAQLS
eukprot:5476393-Pleurochrysis_carterae.AAC.2